MKISKIAGICKKSKIAMLYEQKNSAGETVQQYISNMSAIYPVNGLPLLDKESILTIFDVPEKDRENWYVDRMELPEIFNVEPFEAGELMAEACGLSVVYAGELLKPLRTSQGIVFINSRYLTPLMDVQDVIELYERRTVKGTIYIVAKAGFLVQAVIQPSNTITEGFTEEIERLARLCRQAYAAQEARRKTGEQATSQALFGLDPETGEIVENGEGEKE